MIVAALWCVAAVCFFGARFETNDDAGIANIAAGAFGSDSQYLIHVNILIGWILKLFYSVLPGVAWYAFLTYALLVVSFGAVGFVLVEKFGLRMGFPLYGLILLTAGTDLFCRFQYTKNASFLVAAGLILVIYGLGEMRGAYWSGAILTLFGSMLRIDSLFPVAAISGFAILFFLLRLEKAKRVKAIISVALVFVLSLSAFMINRISYRQDKEWDSFYRFNEAREAFLDYKLQFMGPAYEYYDIGIREADVAMLKSWDIYDPEFFTTEKLEELSKTVPRDDFFTALIAFPGAFLPMLFGNSYVVLLLLALALVLLCCKKKRLLFLFGVPLVAIGGLFFLFWLGRMISRVETSLVFSAALFLLMLIEETPKLKRITLVLAGISVAAAIVFLVPLKQENTYYLDTRLGTRDAFESVIEDREHLYLLDTEHFDVAMGYDVFTPREKGYYDNIVFLGGWLSNSPFQNRTLERYGAANPFRDIVNSETLLLLDTNFKHDINLYINMHYDVAARLVEYDGDRVYQIISEG